MKLGGDQEKWRIMLGFEGEIRYDMITGWLNSRAVPAIEKSFTVLIGKMSCELIDENVCETCWPWGQWQAA
jgi:hypothetical protein